MSLTEPSHRDAWNRWDDAVVGDLLAPDFLGFASTGAVVVYEAAAFFRVAGGRLSEAWVLGDLDGLRGPLGEKTQGDG